MKEYCINTEEKFIWYLMYKYVWKYELESISDAFDMYDDKCIINKNKLYIRR